MNRKTLAAVFAALSLPFASMAAGPAPVAKAPVAVKSSTTKTTKTTKTVQTGPKAVVKAPMKKVQPRKAHHAVKRASTVKTVKSASRK